ncbi:MAG: 3'-5' exonuclease [Campylobacterales bacterium]|nr:3'-5' exonuclease [Campylobacterales bacterium]
MQKVFEELTKAFRKNSGIIEKEHYDTIVYKHSTLFERSDTIYHLLKASGYPIDVIDSGFYRHAPSFNDYKSDLYCIVDIETNGSKPNSSQVIEIGAILSQNGEIKDRFETFVECAFLPDYITKVTGIEPSDLRGAPSQKEALLMLKEFMGESIFVAHNARFDASFLSASMHRNGLGELGNMTVCSLDLAKKTFESERYGLAYLIESLSIPTTTHHRAYSDALSAFYVFMKSFENIPRYVKTSDDLIQFSNSSKKTRSKEKKSNI